MGIGITSMTKCIFRLTIKSSGVFGNHAARVEYIERDSDDDLFEATQTGASLAFLYSLSSISITKSIDCAQNKDVSMHKLPPQ